MPEMLSTLKPLIWICNIFTEEVYGGKSCVISLHNLIHLTDNIVAQTTIGAALLRGQCILMWRDLRIRNIWNSHLPRQLAERNC